VEADITFVTQLGVSRYRPDCEHCSHQRDGHGNQDSEATDPKADRSP
jgi:hypothetical protein